MANFVSYTDLMNRTSEFFDMNRNNSTLSINKFRRRYGNDDFDAFEDPGKFYFKIIFYFHNGQQGEFTSNLLGLDENDTSYSAYSYLMNNAEYERAGFLKEFIYLLSEISAKYPWYFQSIEGLGNTQDRAYIKEFKLEDDKQLTIKCLNDPVDNRISTLLELYRSACFSHVWKKEIVPANLRKFDMGIYIFQQPIVGNKYTNKDKKLTESGTSPSEYANSKYFEFHNCEFMLDSLTTLYNTVDNAAGFSIEPSITISYEDCFTSNYNEWICRAVGDFVRIDLDRGYDGITANSLTDIEQSKIIENTNLHNKDASQDRLNDRLKEDIAYQAKSKLKHKIDDIKHTVFLGNVYGLSLANINMTAQTIASGDYITGAVRAVDNAKGVVKAGKNIVDGTTIKRLGNVAKGMIRNI